MRAHLFAAATWPTDIRQRRAAGSLKGMALEREERASGLSRSPASPSRTSRARRPPHIRESGVIRQSALGVVPKRQAIREDLTLEHQLRLMIAKVRHPIPYRCALWVIFKICVPRSADWGSCTARKILAPAESADYVRGGRFGEWPFRGTVGPGSRSGSENWPGLNGRSYHVASSRAFRSAGAMTSVSRQATSIWSSV